MSIAVSVPNASALLNHRRTAGDGETMRVDAKTVLCSPALAHLQPGAFGNGSGFDKAPQIDQQAPR